MDVSGAALASLAKARPDLRAEVVRFDARVVWIERRTRRRPWLSGLLHLVREWIDWLQGVQMVVHISTRCSVAGVPWGPDETWSLTSGRRFFRKVPLPEGCEALARGLPALESAIRCDVLEEAAHGTEASCYRLN